MNISYNWLKEYANVDLDATRVGELLTDSGLEVEGIDDFVSVPGGFEGLVVGEVLTKEKHAEINRKQLQSMEISDNHQKSTAIEEISSNQGNLKIIRESQGTSQTFNRNQWKST